MIMLDIALDFEPTTQTHLHASRLQLCEECLAVLTVLLEFRGDQKRCAAVQRRTDRLHLGARSCECGLRLGEEVGEGSNVVW